MRINKNDAATSWIRLVIISHTESQNTRVKYSIIPEKMKLQYNHSPFLTLLHNLTSWSRVGEEKKPNHLDF